MTRNPELRRRQVARLADQHHDVFVIGGGINGAVSAAALAAHGLQVGLAERSDFGSFTSQESSNLVWGGFKYLENYEIPLVDKLCRSRNRLIDAYPTSVTQIRFLATLDQSVRFPPWFATLGAIGYWLLGRLATAPPRYLRRKTLRQEQPVIRTATARAGLEYGDAYLRENDARFVWSFVRRALDCEAAAANYVTVKSATFDDRERIWTLKLHDEVEGISFVATAGSIVNCAGPFAQEMADDLNVEPKHRVVFSKGIHLVVRRLVDTEKVLAFFDDTERLFYVIPMANRSVIGTTDTRTDDPTELVTDLERDVLLSNINSRLNLDRPLDRDDIISERSGVRPLVVDLDGGDIDGQDWTALSRKHAIDIDRGRSVVTVLGGKLTDCLNVGEEVLAAISELGFSTGESTRWYGEPSQADAHEFYERARALGLDRAPEIEWADSIAEVLWRRHGLAAHEVAQRIECSPQQGLPIGPDTDVLRAELPTYFEREMVVHDEDLLRRRTKLALIHSKDRLQGLELECLR